MLFLTQIKHFLTQIKLFLTQIKLFSTQIKLFLTQKKLFLTQIKLFLTQIKLVEILHFNPTNKTIFDTNKNIFFCYNSNTHATNYYLKLPLSLV